MIRAFLWRRLLITVPVLIGACLATFLLVRLGGVDPATALAGPLADATEVDRLRRTLGLDQPLLEQFGRYLLRLAHGDFGRSWQSGLPVTEEIGTRIAATMELVFISLFLALAIALPVGLRSARTPNGLCDQVSRATSSLFYAVPPYWLALMAIYALFFRAGIVPAPMGRLPMEILPPPMVTGSNLVDALIAGDFAIIPAQLWQMLLPVLCLTITAVAPLLKQIRAIAMDVMASEYMRVARAYGYKPRTMTRIVLRNGMVPILTFVGGELASLLATTALIEFIFAWGGLGQWGLNAIIAGDYAAVQGFVLVLSLFSIVIFMLVDLVVLVSEPRASLR